MDDNDDNNNNNNDHFRYYPNLSTSCIFWPDDNGNNYCITMNPDHRLESVYLPSTTMLSSSGGLVLSRSFLHDPSVGSYYYVGNPFLNQIPIRIPVPRPHNLQSEAVLATQQQGGLNNLFFRIICLVPNHEPRGNISYNVHICHSNYSPYWFSLSHPIHIRSGDMPHFIVPNSGISCGRWAYWISAETTKLAENAKVIRVDVNNCISRVYPLITLMNLPPTVRGEVRMKLGRIGNRVGLVVVNGRFSRVELYTIDLGRVEDSGGVDDWQAMLGWTQSPRFLVVDLDPNMEENEVDVLAYNRIRCREMPRLIRFQSYKMEVNLLVGGQRLVQWEDCGTNSRKSRVTVYPTLVPAPAAEHLSDRGFAHV